jgi:hypothetical protein
MNTIEQEVPQSLFVGGFRKASIDLDNHVVTGKNLSRFSVVEKGSLNFGHSDSSLIPIV